ncbi:hypothetical protein HY732_04410 [Candidatus Uhrbacteria bacterium]|nr:hypothetical protein [Candidatus Uhrbacteria bacterium]
MSASNNTGEGMSRHICPISELSFEITDTERELYGMFDLPVSDMHPFLRFVMRFAHGNNWSLYWTTEMRTGKKILTCYDPKEFPKIVEHGYWMSNEFDAREYGRAFDFSRPFFEQYFEMVAEIPRPNVTILNCENVEYANHVFWSKNCYLCFICFHCENVLYSFRARKCRESMYLFNCRESELCFQCANCINCFDVHYAEFCSDCRGCRFLSNCIDCSECYQCTNLKHKQYCIQNVQYTKDEYGARMSAIDLSSFAVFQKEWSAWQSFLATQPIQAERNINCEDCTGTLLTNCRSCRNCSNLSNAENSVNSYGNNQSETCDASAEGSQQGVMAVGFLDSQRVAFTMIAEHCYDILYSQHMFQSHDCFGCFGLKKASWCILNKEYEPAEYEDMKKGIVSHMKKTGEWGKYFPPRYSPFAWDDTNAAAVLISSFDDYEDVAARLGLRSAPRTDAMERSDAVSAQALPDRPDDFSENDIHTVWVCSTSGRPYKITKQELALYRRFRAPLPRAHWRTVFEHFYPQMYPMPHEAVCGACGKHIYSYIRPEKTTRILLCDACFEGERA